MRSTPLLSVLLLAPLALAACSSGSADADSSAPAATSTADATTDSSATTEPSAVPTLNTDKDAFAAYLTSTDDGTLCTTWRADAPAFYDDLYSEGWSIDMAAPQLALYCLNSD